MAASVAALLPPSGPLAPTLPVGRTSLRFYSDTAMGPLACSLGPIGPADAARGSAVLRRTHTTVDVPCPCWGRIITADRPAQEGHTRAIRACAVSDPRRSLARRSCQPRARPCWLLVRRPSAGLYLQRGIARTLRSIRVRNARSPEPRCFADALGDCVGVHAWHEVSSSADSR